MRRIMSFKESLENSSKLEKDVEDYLVSIGFNRSALKNDFIEQIIKNEISKGELLELLEIEEINHILSMVRDSKLSQILK